MTATVDFASPLAANLSNVDETLSVANWVMSDGFNTLVPLITPTVGILLNAFIVSTSSTGQITDAFMEATLTSVLPGAGHITFVIQPDNITK